jgi:hypothetical protein
MAGRSWPQTSEVATSSKTRALEDLRIYQNRTMGFIRQQSQMVTLEPPFQPAVTASRLAKVAIRADSRRTGHLTGWRFDAAQANQYWRRGWLVARKIQDEVEWSGWQTDVMIGDSLKSFHYSLKMI